MKPEIVVLAHDIRSTFNVGSILRTSEGLGVNKVIFSGYTPYPQMENDPRLPHESEKLTNQIAKTALGAEKIVPSEISNDIKTTIQDLKSQGFRISALEQGENSIKLQDYHKIDKPQKIALLLGEEVHGIDKDLLKLTDEIIEIPMFGQKESFNVSVAFAIAIWEMRKPTLE